MKIIAFGHRARVGKDSAVKFAMNYMRIHHPKIAVCRLSFGDEIKRIAHLMFSWAGLQDGIYYENHPELKDSALSTVDKSPRQIWIDLGLKGREINEKVWPELALAKVSADIAFCPDLRHPIEPHYVSMFNGLCIRIDRDCVPKRQDGIDNALEGFMGWDYIIDNNETLKDLNFKVQQILKGKLDEWNGKY